MKRIIVIAILLGTTRMTAAEGQAGQAQQAQRPPNVIAIKAGRLIDGTGGPIVNNAVIIVVGDKIENVGPAAQVPIPTGAQVVDLSTKTVMPGLIDGHSHPSVRADHRTLQGQLEGMAHPDAIQMARAARNMRIGLLSGVTTMYVVGEVHHNDFRAKEAVEQGLVPGPRIYGSGPWITSTAGHGPVEYRNTDSPWELRKFVRTHYEAGAHHMKFTIIGARTGPNPRQANYTKEELDAAVDEIHRLGMKATAHASGENIRVALEAGVDSIQHGGGLTEDLVGLFLKTNTGIINTYAIGYQAFFDDEWPYLDKEASSIRDWINRARQVHMTARQADPRREASLKARWKELKMAKDAGVMVTLGTDNMQGLLPLEVSNLVDAGFTPLEAIAAATSVAAKLHGIDQEVGSIQNGRFADIIAVDGRPDQNIDELTPAKFIMVGGKDFSSLSFR